jgi:hypothetical protein
MHDKLRTLIFTLSLTLFSIVVFAADEGVDRAVDGAKDAITAPGTVVEEIASDTSEHGPVGVVTGSVKGGVKAAGQVVKGAAKVGVGVIEAVTKPLTD